MVKAGEIRQPVKRETMGFGVPCPATNRCQRCGGFMVGEFCIDVFNSARELDVMALRCVLCGNVVDPVILQNRKRQQDAITAKTLQMPVQSVGSQVAA